MDEMKIHCLIHVPFEEPGYILQWLEENNHVISFTRFYENPELPEISCIDAVVVMGGPMGTADEVVFPWLASEKRFLAECIASGKKILGICLGAQLTAAMLGADIHTAPYKEIGWFPVYPDHLDTETEWFGEIFRNGPAVFHWHADQFELPEGCASLLKTEANGHQAFVYGTQIIGLQFHLEATESSLEDMLENGKNELSEGGKYVQPADFIRTQTDLIPDCNRLMSRVLEKWLG